MEPRTGWASCLWSTLSPIGFQVHNPTDIWRLPTSLVRYRILLRESEAVGHWQAEGLMEWPDSCRLFKVYWWEEGGIRASLVFFPLSSWLGWNRCLNSKNIWVWVFKWGYKTQEKEQLQVADLGYTSWWEPARDEVLKSSIHCSLINSLSIPIRGSPGICQESGLLLGIDALQEG